MLRKKPTKRKSKVSNPVKRKRKNPTTIITNRFHRIMENNKYYIIVYNNVPVRKSSSPRSRYDIIKWNDEDQSEFNAESYIKISYGELVNYDNIIEIIGPYNSKQYIIDHLT